MRLALAFMLIAAPALASVLASAPIPARAQQVWTPAPVPNVAPAATAPADRAGIADAAGPVSGTPFSAAPSSTSTSGGQTSPADRDTNGSVAASTPSLGK